MAFFHPASEWLAGMHDTFADVGATHASPGERTGNVGCQEGRLDHDSRYPVRRSLRLAGYDYSQAGAYFVTICTHGRVCLFGEVVGDTVRLSRMGEVVQACWEEMPEHYPGVEFDAFVVMPNHVHGIVVIADSESDHGVTPGDACIAPTMAGGRAGRATLGRQARVGAKRATLGRIVGSFKAASAKLVNERYGVAGAKLWQRGYHEHVIRSEAALDRIRRYIEENPLKWALDQDNPSQVGVIVWLDDPNRVRSGGAPCPTRAQPSPT
jgi:putative transposase